MALHTTKKISPCPFSKGYSIPIEQAWSLLKIFFLYRFIISSLFIIILYSHFEGFIPYEKSDQFFYLTSHSYFIFTLFSGVCTFWRLFNYQLQAQLVIFADILFITLLMHASGGVDSGVGILLIISTASGGLLIGGRCALLFAALASLAVITEQVVTSQSNSAITSSTYAGILGLSFFTIAYLSNTLARQTEQSQFLASQHQKTIANLEELNQHIIQHLQSGIIICDLDEKVILCNAAAIAPHQHLQNTQPPSNLIDISPQLSELFQQWLSNHHKNAALLKTSQYGDVYSQFSLLKTKLNTFYMILMEDMMLYNQRLQQNKLASLGCLTASIAHEIRNPLGAISHASQLLSEAPDLSEQDLRLTQIIQSHSERINKIIEDILQLSRRKPSHRIKIKLNQWLKTYLQSFTQTYNCPADSFIIESTDNDLQAYMDVDHLTQILDNLCANALKYGDSSAGKITLRIELKNNKTCLKIIDHADEIPPEIASHLFEPFFTTSPTGTGLGLYISKELAELNQAKLSYALHANRKSCFTLYLPNVDHSLIDA